MRIGPVTLRTGAGGRRQARWRRLTGADELALFGSDFRGAVEWLATMVEAGEGAVGPQDVPELALDDADRLFAALYRALFGAAVELRQNCSACGEGFELTLALDALLSAGAATEPASEAALAGGTRLRCLRLGDLLAADGDREALIERATLARGSDGDAAIEAAFERLAPAAIENIETACPHCRAAQTFTFDLSRFLLACAARERPVLLREVHLLARTYGWGYGEIVGLPREVRHELVGLAVAATPRTAMRAA